MAKRYAVGIEICHVLTEVEARRLADKIRDRLSDMDEDVYVCVTEYEQVGFRKTSWDLNIAETHIEGATHLHHEEKQRTPSLED